MRAPSWWKEESSEDYSWSERSRVDPSMPNGSLPSERTVVERSDADDEDAMPELYNPFEDETGDEAPGESLWLCRDCNSPDWRVMTGWYRCGSCGSQNFYDARAGPPCREWRFLTPLSHGENLLRMVLDRQASYGGWHPSCSHQRAG